MYKELPYKSICRCPYAVILYACGKWFIANLEMDKDWVLRYGQRIASVRKSNLGVGYILSVCRVSLHSVYHATIIYVICCRFSIDLDLDAPKIAIPAKSSKSEEDDTQLLLDLGHFTLHTATVSLFSSEVCCLFCFNCGLRQTVEPRAILLV